MSEDSKVILQAIGELKAEIADVRAEIADVKSELKVEIADVKSELKTEIADVKSELKAEIADVKAEVTEVKEDLKSVKLTIENELRKSINIVCEGHLDLYRKLCDALRYEREKEWMQIRINVLESDVRQIKSHMALCT